MSTTLSRFGTNKPKNKDNTSIILDNDYQAPAYAATLAIAPKAHNTLVKVGTLTGALTINTAVSAPAYVAPMAIGDKLTFIFATDGTNRVVTFGTGMGSAGTLTVVASLKGVACFIFDGAAWVEVSRALTA